MSRYGYSSVAEGDLMKFSDIEAWYAIKDCAQYDKKCSNPTRAISDETIANPNAQIVGDDMVRVQELQALRVPYKPYRYLRNTPPVTYPEEVENTLGTPVEVEPLDETQLEDLGLNTCNHDIPFSNRCPQSDPMATIDDQMIEEMNGRD
ncbi:hypothetical protein Tco_1287091 [Tanacetum coccineum]